MEAMCCKKAMFHLLCAIKVCEQYSIVQYKYKQFRMNHIKIIGAEL